MKRCAIIGCANTSERNPSVNFFFSPNSNQKDRRNIWIAATGRTYTEGAKFCVCEEHFDMSSDVEYYTRVTNKPKLLRNAVPHLKICASSDTSEVFTTSTANVPCSTVGSASILPFIKKEEPVDFDLIVSEETHTAETEPSYNRDDYVPTTEFFSISFKVEPNDEPTADSWNGGIIVDCKEDEEMKDPEYIDCGKNFSGNEMTDEDWTDDAKRKKSKPSRVRNRRRKCPECPVTFLRSDLLRDHLKTHTDKSKVECHKCFKFIPKSYLECHLLIHEGPPFICKICGKSFKQKDCFRSHRKVHWERKYECDVCQKLFLTKGNLVSHLEVHVEREKTFQCPICSATFFRKNTLQRHHRQMHTNTPRKKFKCPNPTCQREYMRSDEFKRHKCRQIVAKLKCGHCSSKFFDRSKRIEHIRQCHNKRCVKCDKSFRDPHKMQLHMAQNCTERIVYDCDLCSVQIVGKPNLMKHFANCHQTYECEYCRRIFQSEGIRRFHMKHICTTRADIMEHSNAQSIGHFECDICGWKFSQKIGIVEHMRIMHSMKSFAGTYFADKFTCFTNRATLELYPCCDKQYVNKALNPMHLPTAKCKFFCKRCRARYSTFYSMYRHTAEHTTRVHQSIRHMETCKRCDRRFKWKVSVPEHLKCVIESG